MSKKNYFTQNAKMSKQSGKKTFNFGIPAYKSKTGLITCPQAGQCLKGCYAKQGAYVWSNVSQAFENRLELTLSANMIETLDNEIKRRKSIERIRIHDSGDFYDAKYLQKWIQIMLLNPNIEFYAYTKMVSMFNTFKKLGLLPSNFTVIYSYGGKEDNLIDIKNDRHSKVFTNEENLSNLGYINASVDDSMALTDNHRVGLIYHGAKSKTWSSRI